MPQRTLCNDCGYVLYEGEELKTPDDIIYMYGRNCPKCGRKFSILPINVDVKPLNKYKIINKLNKQKLNF